LHEARAEILEIDSELNGNQAKAEVGEKTSPNPTSAEFLGSVALSSSTYGPTETHKAALQVAQAQLKAIKGKLMAFVDETMPALEADLKAAGTPWIESQGLIKN
jgi:hypothetical protein